MLNKELHYIPSTFICDLELQKRSDVSKEKENKKSKKGKRKKEKGKESKAKQSKAIGLTNFYIDVVSEATLLHVTEEKQTTWFKYSS